jgi:hypothetical protein
MSLDIGAIVGISVAAAAVAVVSGSLLFRKKPSSPSTNLKAPDQGEKTQLTKDFLSNKISAADFRQKMSNVGEGKGNKKKRRSSRKQSSKKK